MRRRFEQARTYPEMNPLAAETNQPTAKMETPHDKANNSHPIKAPGMNLASLEPLTHISK